MSNYVDFAEYYDGDHAITFDIDFYVNYARECGPPVMELACGTGRVTIPIARQGLAITGVDVSHNMLAVCRDAVEQERLGDKVQLVQADMAGFELPRKDYTLAFIALRSFMHLLTAKEQRACLQSAHDHLRPGGLLIIHVIAPDPEQLAREPEGTFVKQREFTLANGNCVVRYGRMTAHNRERQVRRSDLLFEEYDGAGKLVRTRDVPLFTRYVFRDEMEGLLDAAGFVVEHLFRDFAKNAYDGTGEMIVVARRPGVS